MCLTSITENNLVPSDEWLDGWKVFSHVWGGHYGFMFRTHAGTLQVPFDTILYADPLELFSENHEPYKSGFHVIEEYDDALKYNKLNPYQGAVVAVKYRRVSCRGIEVPKLKISVAQQIKVPSCV